MKRKRKKILMYDHFWRGLGVQMVQNASIECKRHRISNILLKRKVPAKIDPKMPEEGMRVKSYIFMCSWWQCDQ